MSYGHVPATLQHPTLSEQELSTPAILGHKPSTASHLAVVPPKKYLSAATPIKKLMESLQ